MDTASTEKDTIEQFFDHMELLRWALKNQEAIDRINERIKDKTLQGKSSLLMRAYNEQAENFRLLKDSKKAIAIVNEVKERYRIDPSLEKIELVRCVFYQGKIFRTQGSFDSAEYHHRKAIELADSYNIRENVLIGEIWMELGYIQTTHHADYKKALNYNKRAQEIFEKTIDKWNIKRAVLYYALASNYRVLGDYERAINYSRMAELIYRKFGDYFTNRALNCKVVQANCYLDNENFEEANAVFENVIEIYTNTIEPTRSTLVGILLSNGVALLHLKEYERARKSIERSIELNPIQYDSDSLDLIYAYSNLAIILEELNQLDKAKELLEKCLLMSLNLFGEKHIEVFEGYRYLGINYAKQHQLEKALVNYQMALIAAFKGFDVKNIYINPSSFDSIPKNAAFNILFDKARVFKKKYELDKNHDDLLAAFDLYKIAYRLIREAANSDFMEESLLNIPETFKDDLNYGVECALALYKSKDDPFYLDQLLQFVETNKYFLLQNSMAKSNKKEMLGIPDSAYQKERELLQQINSLKQEINNTSFESDQLEYNKRLDLLNTTIEWENIRKQWNNSKSSNLAFSDLSTTISLDSIKNKLVGNNDILLEYFETADTLYTLAISKQKEKIIQLAKSHELDTQLRIYLEHIFHKDRFSTKNDFVSFIKASHFLYQNLVHPVLSNMDIQTNENVLPRLTIIPNDRLAVLPFESLIQDPGDTTYINYFGLNYLCRDYTINYAYSINILSSNLMTEEKHQNSNILAFSYTSSEKNNSMVTRDGEYGELPYSAVELRNVQHWIANGKFFDGDDATESNFKSNVHNYNIIHLALHGSGDTLDMLNSQIIFKDAGDSIEDGYLYAHELYGIDLSRADMAVLSACETGIGKTMQGEGVYSLARGFAYAGCPSIVMSLWKVSDQTSAEIMDFFYENIARGFSKDVALQQAKIKYLEKSDDASAHPANWAAFISLGNNEPIIIEQSSMQWYYWIIIVGVLIFVFWLYNHKFRT